MMPSNTDLKKRDMSSSENRNIMKISTLEDKTF